MSTFNPKSSDFQDGERQLPFGVSLECLKRANSLHARLSDLGFPWESEIEIERGVFGKPSEGVLIRGELNITC